MTDNCRIVCGPELWALLKQKRQVKLRPKYVEMVLPENGIFPTQNG